MTIETLAGGLALALLINLPILLREKRLRRLSQAKLEIAKAALRMEKLMLQGRIRLGHVCHDCLYRMMMQSHYEYEYAIPWVFWRRPTEQSREFRKKLSQEMMEKSDLSKIVMDYVRADFQAFKNSRPVVSILFMVWVLFCAGGITMIIVGFIGFLKAKQAMKDVWKSFRELVAVWYVISTSQSLRIRGP